jgi:hypothetical protein
METLVGPQGKAIAFIFMHFLRRRGPFFPEAHPDKQIPCSGNNAVPSRTGRRGNAPVQNGTSQCLPSETI